MIKKHIKKLLIEAAPGEGKTSLLLSELSDSLKKAAGFRTVRVIGTDGETKGFAHVPPDSEERTETVSDAEAGNEFLVLSGGGTFRKEVFIGYSIPAMKRKDKRFILIDELGGFEMDIPEVYEAFERIFEGDTPVIGIIKSDGHAKNFAYGNYLRFRRMLEEREDTEIIGFSRAHAGEACAAVRAWMEENLKPVETLNVKGGTERPSQKHAALCGGKGMDGRKPEARGNA